MATRRCPRCKLINPGTTTACDCGWSFVDRKMGEPRRHPGHEAELARQSARHAYAARMLGLGALLVVIGGGVLVATTKGRVSAYALLVGGGLTVLSGLIALLTASARGPDHGSDRG